MIVMVNLRAVVDRILTARRSIPTRRSVLVAISGIDGCGKGYLTARIVTALQARGVRAAVINIDGWLNLPSKRFDASSPAEHFYLHAIRFAEMFAQLILPLRDQRSVRLIDVIALEGIYLLKRAFLGYYGLSIWIECSFDTALERAHSTNSGGT
jgi:uridine kinase